MGKVLIGRDATVYTLAAAGIDTTVNGANPGNPVGILGIYKSISVTLSRDWEDVTPSSASLKEKRRTTLDWKARLTNQIRSGGATGFALALDNDYIMVIFTEEATGKTIQIIGGISESEYERDRGEAKDTLSIENVGQYNGGASLSYI